MSAELAARRLRRLRPALLRWLLPWLLWLHLPAAASLLDLGDAYFESVGDAEQIPDNNVTALAEDRAGFLWIGTPDGLIRYDGYRFQRLELRPQDATDGRSRGVFVRALLSARDGRLWMGTDADGLWVFDGDSLAFRQVQAAAGGLLSDNVRALAEDSRGDIWIGTRAGLNRWRAGHADCPQLAPGAVGNAASACRLEAFAQRYGEDTRALDERILALLVQPDDSLLIGSWNGLGRRLADGRFERMHAEANARPNLARLQLLSLTALQDGRVAVGTAQDGAFLLSADGSRIERIPRAEAAAVDATAARTGGLASYSLAMVQPVADELWMGGFGGIAVLDAHSGRLLRSIRPDIAVPGTLAHDQVRTMLVDRAGQVWVGGYGGGLQRHDPKVAGIRVLHHSPTRPTGPSSSSFGAVLELDNGELWLGTRDNGVDIIDPARGLIGGWRAATDDPQALSHPLVQSLAQTRDGSVWVGTLALLHRRPADGAASESFTLGNGLSGNTARRLLAAADGRLWVGSNAGLLYWRPGMRQLQEAPGAGGERASVDVNALAEAADGRLWVGSNAGLYTRPPDQDLLLPVAGLDAEDTRLAGLTVVGLLIDRAGTLWIDGSEGLLRLQALSEDHSCGAPACPPRLDLHKVGPALGLPAAPVGANLLQDRQGRLWTQRYLIDPVQQRTHELTRADGVDIGTAWFRAYAATRDGLLLYGGSRGLLMIDPERYQPWQYQPPLVISELRVDGHTWVPQRWRQGLQLEPAQRSFSVEFAALDLSAPQRNRYRYRLQGFDNDWIDSDSSRRVATYANLWPGDYLLEVEASNRTGQWLPEPLRLPVRVLPAFWQTGWFAALLLLLLALAIRLGVRRHTARLRAHERELEELVRVRTAQLQEAKEDAEGALQQLQSTQRQLVASEKMASLGQLVAGVAHEINTPLGIALTAASHLGDEVRSLQQKLAGNQLRQRDLQDFLHTAHAAGDLVDRNLGRAAQLVRSFKQVSADRSSDERRSFLLADSLADLCESLQLGWKPRPIRIEWRCPADLQIDGHAGTLGQILSTLAHNALLHAYAPDQPGLLQVEAELAADGLVCLSFSDDGRGIAATDLPRVFEPFYTTRRADGSIGLGLHTVFNLVNARLGGSIEVTSQPGLGTRFVMRFPRVAP